MVCSLQLVDHKAENARLALQFYALHVSEAASVDPQRSYLLPEFACAGICGAAAQRVLWQLELDAPHLVQVLHLQGRPVAGRRRTPTGVTQRLLSSDASPSLMG